MYDISSLRVKLAMFYNNCLLYDNGVTFYTCDVLDISRVTV